MASHASHRSSPLASLQYSASESFSSFAPSTPSTSASEAIAINTDPQSSLSSKQKHAARRSLSLLGKDFSTIFRSHSSSRRQTAFAESDLEDSQAAKVLLPGYADVQAFKPDMQLVQSVDMFASGEAERDTARPSRKSESRLYNFLHRSRSRSRTRSHSRSKSDQPALVDIDSTPVPELSNGFMHGHSRHSSMGQVEFRGVSPAPGAKPSTRVQSRPLSSTTTATNTTIKPIQTRRPRKHPPDPLPIPVPASTYENNPTSVSRPSTPTASKSSATRKKLHNLFGIPLSGHSSSRKSISSRSRPASPLRVSSDAGHSQNPPLNSNDGVIDGTTPSLLHRPPPSRPQSPAPSPPTRPKPKPSAGISQSRLAKLFSSRNVPHHHNNQMSDPGQSSFSTASSTAPCAIVSGPSSMSRASHSRKNSRSTDISGDAGIIPVRTSQQTIIAPLPRAATIPLITHTPPTPQRSTTSPPRLSHRQDSMESQHRYHTVSMVDEERPSGSGSMKGLERGGSKDSRDKGKDRQRDVERKKVVVVPGTVGSPVMRMNSTSTSTSGHGHGYTLGPAKKVGSSVGVTGRTKHGSFDFERPSWGGGGSRSTSSKSRGVKPSKEVGSGMAGIGTQRSSSLRRAREYVNGHVKDKSALQPTPPQTGLRPLPAAIMPLQPDHTGASGSSHAHSHSTTQTRSTTGTGGTGMSSSLGRATGKKTRLVHIGLSHGPFAFEPAVPSPTQSTGFEQSDPASLSNTSRRGEHLGAIQREHSKEKEWPGEREREKERRRDDKTPVPVPVPVPNAGYRSGTKGRSLDLGLGLAWAPSKVREEALLPSSFGRSLSMSRKGDNTWGGRRGVDRADLELGMDGKDKSKVGREVAEVFRNALDDAGYASFKKYVHRFDAHDIPFDGPTGIVARVERLLASAPDLGDDGKRNLLDNFVRIILQNA